VAQVFWGHMPFLSPTSSVEAQKKTSTLEAKNVLPNINRMQAVESAKNAVFVRVTLTFTFKFE